MQVLAKENDLLGEQVKKQEELAAVKQERDELREQATAMANKLMITGNKTARLECEHAQGGTL